MADLVIKTNTSGNDASVTLNRGSAATHWKMLAQSGNFFLQHQINNAGEWKTSLRINETNQGNNMVFVGSITATSFIGNLSGTASYASNSDCLDSLHASSFLQCAGGQTLTGVIHLSSTGAVNAADSTTILAYNNSSCSNASTGTCIGGLGNMTTIRGNALYHAIDATNKSVILTAANYTSYAPSKTGSGASGTWNIDISGKATFSNLSLGNADTARPVIFQDSNLYTDKLSACYANNFKYNPASGNFYVPHGIFSNGLQSAGHLYLTGANASSSTSNTSQIVFGTASNNHVVISSNTNCLIINPSTSTTSGQIAMYTDKQSSFPNGIGMGPLSASTGTFSGAVSASSVSAAAHYGCLFLQNLGYTCYGTADPNSAGLDKVEGRVYFKI